MKGVEYVVCLPPQQAPVSTADASSLEKFFDLFAHFLGHSEVLGPNGEVISTVMAPHSSFSGFVWSFLVLYFLNHISNKRTGTAVYQTETDLEPLLAELKEIKKELKDQSKDKPIDGRVR